MIRLLLRLSPGEQAKKLSVPSLPACAGRNVEAEIPIAEFPGSPVSWDHFRLATKNGGYTVEDLGSTNGTFLNDKRLDEHLQYPIKVGDQIRMGASGPCLHVSSTSDDHPQTRLSKKKAAAIDIVSSMAKVCHTIEKAPRYAAITLSSECPFVPLVLRDSQIIGWRYSQGSSQHDITIDGASWSHCLGNNETSATEFQQSIRTVIEKIYEKCNFKELAVDGLGVVIPECSHSNVEDFAELLPFELKTKCVFVQRPAATLAWMQGKRNNYLMAVLSEDKVRLYRCEKGKSHWSTERIGSTAEISAYTLRSSIEDALAEYAIRHTRRDPRELVGLEDSLALGVRSTFYKLCSGNTARVLLEISGERLDIRLSPSDLEDSTSRMRSAWGNLISEGIAKCSFDQTDLIISGDLANAIPLESWARKVVQSRINSISISPPHAMAGGAAILAAYHGTLTTNDTGIVRTAQATISLCPTLACTQTPEVYLVDHAGKKTQLPQEGVFTLGRVLSSDLRIDGGQFPTVSDKHAEITAEETGFFLRDAGSSNGTYVNGVRLNSQHNLANNDNITLGKSGPCLRYEVNT